MAKQRKLAVSARGSMHQAIIEAERLQIAGLDVTHVWSRDDGSAAVWVRGQNKPVAVYHHDDGL